MASTATVLRLDERKVWLGHQERVFGSETIDQVMESAHGKD